MNCEWCAAGSHHALNGGGCCHGGAGCRGGCSGGGGGGGRAGRGGECGCGIDCGEGVCGEGISSSGLSQTPRAYQGTCGSLAQLQMVGAGRGVQRKVDRRPGIIVTDLVGERRHCPSSRLPCQPVAKESLRATLQNQPSARVESSKHGGHRYAFLLTCTLDPQPWQRSHQDFLALQKHANPLC